MIEQFEQYAHQIALQDDHSKISYYELIEAIKSRSEQLNGVIVLGLAMDNCIDWIIWDLSCLYTDIPCIPIPPFFSQEQISHIIKSAGVTHVVKNNQLLSTGNVAANTIPQKTSKITFTSGTTGTPKGVCLTRKLMETVAKNISDRVMEFAGKKHLSVMPLSILLENVAGVYTALFSGCRVNLKSMKDYGKNYQNLHDIIQKEKPESIILVPEILRILMTQVITQGPLESLKFIAVGGSKINPDLIKNAHHLGLPVYEGYGLSECGSVVSINTPNQNRQDSVGKILPHIEAKIVNDEIIIKNAGFLGYLGEAAPKWLATGDLGSLDSEGFLSIHGRSKNIIITGFGRNISPEWVESTLLTNPAISQCLVYGDGQPHLSALIVSKNSKNTLDIVLNKVNQSLPDYAQVKQYHIVEPFSLENGLLTGTGRPIRNKIMNLYHEMINYEATL